MSKAWQLTKDDDNFACTLTDLTDDMLMEGDVEIDVAYSTINYKDGLAMQNKSPVVRRWPMIPGIDFSGTVTSSSNPEFKPGDEVILNGWGVGETHCGGLAQKARVKGDWLIHRPDKISAAQAMSIGTAGYTAMLCVMALQNHHVTPDQGPILVTGANGGVGSVAISLLSALGYEVLASTGRPEEADFLKSLGANDIIDRNELSEKGRPMGKERWAGAVDAVGSHTLANVLAQTKYGGTVSACGLAQGFDLPATVMPFILRGVTLAGIDSVMAPKTKRLTAWGMLAELLDMSKLEALTTTVGLADAEHIAGDILKGQVRGRVVVDVNA